MQKQTDWDSYYKNPYFFSRITREISAMKLKRIISRYLGGEGGDVVELGGGNSCFYRMICETFRIKRYTIVDNNELSLQKFSSVDESPSNTLTKLINCDILNQQELIKMLSDQADIVLSVGLVEHFSGANFTKVIESHFALAKSNGIVIITFPTPTFLYKITRKLSELIGLWIFYDEIPLKMSEVREAVRAFGIIESEEINWPIILTQGIIVIRKI